jgi:hypothetical protein
MHEIIHSYSGRNQKEKHGIPQKKTAVQLVKNPPHFMELD